MSIRTVRKVIIIALAVLIPLLPARSALAQRDRGDDGARLASGRALIVAGAASLAVGAGLMFTSTLVDKESEFYFMLAGAFTGPIGHVLLAPGIPLYITGAQMDPDYTVEQAHREKIAGAAVTGIGVAAAIAAAAVGAVVLTGPDDSAHRRMLFGAVGTAMLSNALVGVGVPLWAAGATRLDGAQRVQLRVGLGNLTGTF